MTTPEEDDLANASMFKLRRRRRAQRRRLNELLSRAEPAGFMQLIWALAAFARGDVSVAKRYAPRFSAVQLEQLNDWAVLNPWTLETLVNEYLATASTIAPWSATPQQLLNLANPNVAAELINAIRDLENVEDAMWHRRNPDRPLSAFGHIAQRQFPWQRGLIYFLEFYRPLFLFDTPEARAEFARRTDVSLNDFAKAGFGLLTVAMKNPFVSTQLDLSLLDLDPTTSSRVVRLLSQPILDARREAAMIRTGFERVAYSPSALRRHPCISFPSQRRLIAPLPELISTRVGDGIFYDLSGASAVSNLVGARFEKYTETIVKAYLPSIQMEPEARYHLKKGNEFRTPDWRLGLSGETFAVVECKARRASVSARYSSEYQNDDGLRELAKGVFQIWRYFSHVRRDFFRDGRISDDTVGILLTLDTWVDMAIEGQQAIFAMATELADTEGSINDDDRRPVGILHIRDLEGTLASATEDSLISAISSWLRDPRYSGWSLWSVHKTDDRSPQTKSSSVFDRLERPTAMKWWPTADSLG